ncbi:MAG: hypothetical protein M1816_004295 [Peltula sp. TS41687]|nr:MAG: hypothetical protein M1816_004295 [Peltula sp. TS41687]
MAATINDLLKDAIVDARGYDKVNNILCDLVFSRTNVVLSAEKLVRYAHDTHDTHDAHEVFLKLNKQILDLACNHPFLQSLLVQLVTTMNGLPRAKYPAQTLELFGSSFASLREDRLVNASHRFRVSSSAADQPSSSGHVCIIDDSSLRYHGNMHSFMARLIIEEHYNHRRVDLINFTWYNEILTTISFALELPHAVHRSFSTASPNLTQPFAGCEQL